jgi:hypothetical protein
LSKGTPRGLEQQLRRRQAFARPLGEISRGIGIGFERSGAGLRQDGPHFLRACRSISRAQIGYQHITSQRMPEPPSELVVHQQPDLDRTTQSRPHCRMIDSAGCGENVEIDRPSQQRRVDQERLCPR